LPPYFAGQIRAALALARGMEAERRALLERANRMIRTLREQGFDTAGSASQIVPIVLGKNEDALQAAAHLQREGFAVRAIRPPTVPEGKACLRLSLIVPIAEAELTRLVECLTAWREKRAIAVTPGAA
jgi:8-amino-7-oxononanoate synthase